MGRGGAGGVRGAESGAEDGTTSIITGRNQAIRDEHGCIEDSTGGGVAAGSGEGTTTGGLLVEDVDRGAAALPGTRVGDVGNSGGLPRLETCDPRTTSDGEVGPPFVTAFLHTEGN